MWPVALSQRKPEALKVAGLLPVLDHFDYFAILSKDNQSTTSFFISIIQQID